MLIHNAFSSARRRLAVVISLTFLVLAAACSASAPSDTGSTSVTFKVTGVKQLSQDDQSHPVHLQWPILSNASELNTLLESWETKLEEDFLADNPGGGVASPELNGTWEFLGAQNSMAAVRLHIYQFAGANGNSSSHVFFGSAEQAWSASELLDGSQLVNLSQAILDQLEDSQAMPITAQEMADTPEIFDDLTFTEQGDLRILLPEGSVVESAAGQVEVTVPAGDFLNESGKQVAAALAGLTDGTAASATPSASTATSHIASATPSATPSPSPSPTPSATPSQAAASTKDEDAVDCSEVKCVALTFDDGPGPYTEQILDTLDKYDVKATFFELGPSVSAYPDVVKRQIADGMVIGTHTMTHRQLTLLSQSEQQAETDGVSEQLTGLGAPYPTLMRPPYGSWNSDTQKLGYSIVLWNVDSEDWKNRDADITIQNILEQTKNGSIILMHDIHPSTAQALPGIIEQLEAKGYTLVTVPELLGESAAGQVYYGQ